MRMIIYPNKLRWKASRHSPKGIRWIPNYIDKNVKIKIVRESTPGFTIKRIMAGPDQRWLWKSWMCFLHMYFLNHGLKDLIHSNNWHKRCVL